ncbi:hypothetical protein [Flavobacterium sp. GCM10023249]|uniref:hypothetical protein n=1 Tax=unclassified Flavobacterium TaxID=196869 RepID=UPI0036213EAC
MRFLYLLIFFVIVSCNKIDLNDNEVRLMVDGVKHSEFFFRKSGEVSHMNIYFSEGNIDDVLSFDYVNGNLDRVRSESDYKTGGDWETDYYKNTLALHEYLLKNGVKVGHPFLVAEEMNDFCKLADAIQYFSKGADDKVTAFWAKDINVKAEFDSSTIRRFISTNSVIHYFEYAVNKEGYLVYEIIQFDQSALKISYEYEDNKISKITYKVLYRNGKLEHSHKEFLYKAI